MPIYSFRCENEHLVEKWKRKPYKNRIRFRCPECGLWMYRSYTDEHSKQKPIHLDYENDPISHLAKKDSFKGVRIDNLTPEPIYVRSREQYDHLLKKTHSLEKETRYGG